MRRTKESARLWLGLLLASCTRVPTAAPWTGPTSEADVAKENPRASDNGSGESADAATEAAPSAQAVCTQHPRSSVARRLSREEYNNTLRDLLGDATSPGNALPSDVVGNNFGNDASKQAVSSLLAEQYGTVAEAVAARATETQAALLALAPCAKNLSTKSSELACARTSIERLTKRAWRRAIAPDELSELVELWQGERDVRDFGAGMQAVIEALLQSPDFLYRIERGEPDPASPGSLRPNGYEMATRLSYMYWGTMPDETLLTAAENGQLVEPAQIRAQALRLLNERERSRNIVRFFFDSILPISALGSLSRDSQSYPTFTRHISMLLREETLQYLEHEIFDQSSSWPEILTQPYSYLNEELAEFYGIDGVQGSELRKVPIDTSQRLGLLTQAGVLAGTIHSNITSPVLRGSFVVQRILCRSIPLPTGDLLARIKPPEPTSGRTGRERYAAHSTDPACHTCHQYMDPVGLALENFDAVGRFRNDENGVRIDPTGSLPDSQGSDLTFSTPVELVRMVAAQRETTDCFATQWLSYAYGQSPDDLDPCAIATIQEAFEKSDYSVFSLLLSLTQTDSFLHLPSPEEQP